MINIKIPESWDNITLNKFIKLQGLYTPESKPTIIDIISVLGDIDKNILMQAEAEEIDMIANHLDYLSKPISNKITNEIIIGNDKYIINTDEKMKFGEYVDCQTILDSDKTNYSAILGIICRKENEIYDDDFIANKLNDRIDMFANMPITKVYPTITFFLTKWVQSSNNIQLYSERLKDLTSHILRQLRTSKESGIGKRRFMNWRMKKLEKLEKSLKCI